MNHQQIREELSKAEQTQKAASESIARLTKLLNEPEGVWKAAYGGKYWAVNPWLGVEEFHHTGEMDEHCHSIGNCFPTKEAAELHVKRLKVIQKLRELAGGFKPDWNNNDEDKYSLIYQNSSKKWMAIWTWQAQDVFNVYFKSKEAVEAAVTTLGDELNVLLEQ